MAKDINIHVKTRGAAETKRQLDSVGQSGQKVGSDVKGGSDKGTAGLGDLQDKAHGAAGEFDTMGDSVVGWSTKLAGITAIIAAVTKAISAQTEAMKEHARVAAEQQKALTALQHLGDIFEKRPELRKEVAAYAEYGRRPFEEVAKAWYTLESKGAGLSEEQKQGIMKEALELGRQEPAADLSGIIDMFSLYVKETKEQDINLVQNVLRQTVTSAGAELAQVGKLLPRVLPLGISGGLTPEQAAGLWAFATTKTAEPETATVGLRNILMSLQGKGTPESQELMASLGVKPGAGFFDQLSRLADARQRGKFGLPQAEVLAGKENAAILLSMLSDQRAMMETISEVTGAARPDRDIVKEGLERVLGADEVAKAEDESRQLDVVIQNIKARDTKALERKVLVQRWERHQREIGEPEWKIQRDKLLLWGAGGAGVNVENTEKALEQARRSDALSRGMDRVMRGERFLGNEESTSPAEPNVPAEPNEPVRVTYHLDNRRIFNPVVGRSADDIYAGARAPRMVT